MNTVFILSFVGIAAAAPAWNIDEDRWANPSYSNEDHKVEKVSPISDQEKPWTTAYGMKHDGFQRDPVPKVVPGEPHLEPYNYLVTSEGDLFVNGQKVNPGSSTNDEKYPAGDGWEMFIYKKVTFYVKREKKGGKFQIVPVAQKETKLRVTTPDDVTHEWTLHNADGRVTNADEKEMVLYVSNNAKHPEEDGWQMFDDPSGARFYLNANDGHMCFSNGPGWG